MAITSHSGQGLPAARLLEIHDMLALALDATENTKGYPQPIREARSYMRTALRHTVKLMGDGA
ncbi:hypothetical protein [Pararhodobacter aggregans]|uniref:Uncharacterized protein n=1 Tax=Pararhodobacter aggregans TaxID=404875 RepID=A0A2T7ULU3_9RHOB|nr:hypothetical protein [Pararhodobacter aggregans]PTW99059.1 hypothetical protein C8N33_11845 [Pararhodobacter aggregans]PVE45619.1 hypothetical protein DDE23_20355 [Pararhodobacter aggregans]